VAGATLLLDEVELWLEESVDDVVLELVVVVFIPVLEEFDDFPAYETAAA
jgi:hypothetical protein